MKLAFIVDPEDKPWLSWAKSTLQGHKVDIIYRCPDTTVEVTMQYDGIICSQEKFLKLVVTGAKHGISIDNYAGSLFWRQGKPIIIVNPPKQLMTVAEGQFLFARYVSKILKPELWQSEIQFQWEEVTDGQRFIQLYTIAQKSIAISIDVETAPDPLRIQICSYSLIFEEGGQLQLRNFTFAIDSNEHFRWMQLLNNLPVPKVMQNGIYDGSWFVYYGCPPQNWLFDTQDLFHSWYSELPKRLDFVTSFCVRNSFYWKGMAKTGVREDFLRYGCMDVWATSCSFLFLVEAMPKWAWKNYLIKFPLNFPALLCGYRGWKIDVAAREQTKSEEMPDVEDNLKLLQQVTRMPGLNPQSSPQMQAVLRILNANPKLTVDSADEKMILKIGEQHPFNNYICEAILEYKKAKKVIGSYLDAILLNGRFLYTLGPSGSDTARFVSRKSVFWTGNSIQVIPRDKKGIPSKVKSSFIADEGFYLAEPDAEQAEARCVAYLSGDENLIATVESPLDYHRQNAEKFFGIPYNEVEEDIRDLSKRTNHGANYNMGADVLLQTMGIKNVVTAQRLLKLPREWSLKQVCQYLLDVYSGTYPEVKGSWYQYLLDCVQATHKYTSQLGWTRFFFGRPWEKGHKLELNSLVAHAPQNLNVGIINESFLKLYEFEKRTAGEFQLRAQIHDSIPFQYRIGRLDLAVEATRIMERAYSIQDCKGKLRQMLIPIALKAEAPRWSELKKIPWRTMTQ